MPNRRLNPLFDRTINITFTISGVGSFVDASVKVSSDSSNLVKNSLRVRGYYWATDGKLHPFFDSAEVNYNYTTNVGTSFSRATDGEIGFSGLVPGATPGYLDSSRIQLLGSIVIDSSGMSSGSYTIKVTFTVHTESGNYKFDDSVNYEILDFWQANPWATTVIGGIILAAIGGSVRWLLYRRGRSKTMTQQMKEERKKKHHRTVHRSRMSAEIYRPLHSEISRIRQSVGRGLYSQAASYGLSYWEKLKQEGTVAGAPRFNPSQARSIRS